MRRYFDTIADNVRQVLPDNLDRRHCLTALDFARIFAERSKGGGDDPPPPPPPDLIDDEGTTV